MVEIASQREREGLSKGYIHAPKEKYRQRELEIHNRSSRKILAEFAGQKNLTWEIGG